MIDNGCQVRISFANFIVKAIRALSITLITIDLYKNIMQRKRKLNNLIN